MTVGQRNGLFSRSQSDISSVVEKELCTGCGTCVGVCPQNCITIRTNPARGSREPVVDRGRCAECGVCVHSCPGYQLDVASLRPLSHRGEVVPLLGSCLAAYLGCSSDDDIRVSAASGGMVSEVLIYLLEHNLIDGAVVTRMSNERSLETETFIARTRQEVLSAQKSKYCPAPVNIVLREIRNSEGRYALVGLPCHVEGIRKAQGHDPVLVERLPYVLSLFCSRTPNANATRLLLYRLGVNEHNVASISYRGEGFPGRMRIVLGDGTQRFVDHLEYSYWGYVFYKFFIPPRCWLCPDHAAELADMSFADNWTGLPPFKDDSKGSSTIVVRTPACLDLLQRMENDKRVILHPITVNTVIASQDLAHKSNIVPRMRIWRQLGHAVPDYGEVGSKPSPKELCDAFLQTIRVVATQRRRAYWIWNSIIRCFWILECRWLPRRFQRILALVWRGIKALVPQKRSACAKTHRYKVIMIGGFGGHDIGDEAMPHADRLNLRALLDDNVEIVMLSHDPQYTASFHGERSVYDVRVLGLSPERSLKARSKVLGSSILFLVGALAERYGVRIELWPSARSMLDELASADLLFNVGGGNLNSVIPQELYKKCTEYLAAYILSKPVILSGQTIGPFTKGFDTWYARLCLDRVHMITFRDKRTSYQRIRAIGVSRPKMLDAADDAMTIPAIAVEEAERILQREAGADWIGLESSLMVALNLKGSLKLFKGEDRHSGLEREVRLMARIADQLIREYGAKIMFIPTDYCPGVDDREAHRDILSHMTFLERVCCIEGEYDDATLKGLIGPFDLAIGARYHFAVFAASMRVPFLGIASGVYQQTKLKGLADLCELPQCFVQQDMEFASYEEVWTQITRVVQERKVIQRKLKRIVPSLEERSLLAVREATRLLKTIRADE
jgi:coenzyme F420-reducing hydrogenase beta subunit/polysaccharide pyruvyl transferase WcaK-like protein